MTSEEMEQIAEHVTARFVKSRGPRKDWTRSASVVGVILSVASLIFSAGLNWSRIGSVENRQTEIAAEVKELKSEGRNVAVSIADMRGDMRTMSSKLEGIGQDIAEIKGRLNRAQ